MIVGALIGGGIVILLIAGGVVAFVAMLHRDRKQPTRGFDVIQEPGAKKQP